MTHIGARVAAVAGFIGTILAANYATTHRLSTVVQIYGNAGGREHWPAALGVDWMTTKEMTECVPPAYTEHIGRQLLAHIGEVAA